MGTPAPVVSRVFKEFNKALSSAAAKAHGAEMGYEYGSESPEEFSLFIKSEISKWGQVVKDAKIKME